MHYQVFLCIQQIILVCRKVGIKSIGKARPRISGGTKKNRPGVVSGAVFKTARYARHNALKFWP
jgi:hypothetical protein